MEEQLKARLIGAVVLVALAVLLIPELLSGRKPAADAGKAADATRGTRTYVIDLGGAVAAGARLEPASTSDARQSLPTPPMAARAEPSPEQASGTRVEAVPAAQAAAAQPTVASSSGAAAAAAPVPAGATEPAAAKPAPLPKAASGAGQWVVQVGAFSSAASARKLIGELQRDGYAAFESPLERSGKTLHRVRVGPEPDKAAADKLSTRLKSRGLPVKVVTND